MSPNTNPAQQSGALTEANDWISYYTGMTSEVIAERARAPCVFDEFIHGRTGTMFELGCGGSPFLARGAEAGWTVGGIDFLAPSLQSIKKFLTDRQLKTNYFIQGDLFTANLDAAEKSADLIISAGLLEHFKDPAPLLERWSSVLKDDGLVVSAIPNLLSVNAKIFAKYDPEFYAQHVVFSPADMDAFHERAGLLPVRPAAYVGSYDIHMLIPWDKFEQQFPHPQLYRLFKLSTTFGIGKPLQMLPLAPSKTLSPSILGVYAKPQRAKLQ